MRHSLYPYLCLAYAALVLCPLEIFLGVSDKIGKSFLGATMIKLSLARIVFRGDGSFTVLFFIVSL